MSLKFIDEEWSWENTSLWNYVCEGNLPKKWQDFFDQKDIQKILQEISEQISNQIVYPSPNRVFRAFNLPLDKIKVVIIGQDPYFDGNAVGVCFSIPPGRRINPSLQNIYTELESEGFSPQRTGSLLHWVEQGCLMLNTALTVEKNNAESHLAFWRPFAEKVLQYISLHTKNVAWILMGKHAASFQHCAQRNGHKAFITSHPSPFSARRPFQNYPAFIGSGIFQQVNDFLDKQIKW